MPLKKAESAIIHLQAAYSNADVFIMVYDARWHVDGHNISREIIRIFTDPFNGEKAAYIEFVMTGINQKTAVAPA